MAADKEIGKGDEMPWCGECGSYHLRKNPTCRKLWPKEYTLLATGHGFCLAEEHWHSPRDGQRGPMRTAWVKVDTDLLATLRKEGVDTGGPWHAGGWMTIPVDMVPLDYRERCMWGMIEAKGRWADGTKKREGDPGVDWREGLGLVRR